MKLLVLLLKVFLPSLLISLGIKYLGPFLALEDSNLNATIAIILPPAAIAALLTWHGLKEEKESDL